MNDNENTLLTLAEVRSRLKIGISTLYWLRKRNEIKTVNIGGAIRVKASELDRYIANAEEKTK
jgi:excisionase family DNA binding protein